MKKCKKCGITKQLSEYYKSKTRPDGYRDRCKDCKSIENKSERENNAAYYQDWRDNHKDYIKKYNQTYIIQNKERIAALKNEYAKQNKVSISTYKRKWYESNKAKVLEGKRRRRERQIVSGELYSSEHEQITLRAFSNKCFNCGSKDKLHIDHHRPLIKGYALSLDNAVVLCEFCNKSKGTKDPEVFYNAIQYRKVERILAKVMSADIKKKRR